MSKETGVTKGVDEKHKLLFSVRKTLEKYDKTAGDEQSLVKLWEDIWQIQDTNEFVRNNLMRIQLLFEQEYNNYLTEKADHKAIIKSRQFTGTKKKLAEQQSNFRRRELEDGRHLESMTRTVAKLAQEYRQCLLSQKNWFHISLFFQLTVMLKAVLFEEIHDQNLLNKISVKLGNACRKLFGGEMARKMQE